MNKKLYIMISVIAISIIGISTVIAGEIFNNPEINALQKLLSKGINNSYVQDKTNGLEALREEESRIQARQNISKEKQNTIIQEKEQGHRERTKEIVLYNSSSILNTQPEQTPFRGILEGNSVPAPFQSDEFTVLNFWGGEIDSKAIGVYAGYRPENPSQGVIVVFDDKNDAQGKFYSTPESTGPVRIISELNGIITLKSITGEFEAYDQNVYPPTKVHVPGLIINFFDIRKRIFQ